MIAVLKKYKFLNFIMEYAISISLFILIWQIYVLVKKVPPFILPQPASVFGRLWELIVSGEIWGHFTVTTGEVLLGFIVGSLLGMVCGYVMVKAPTLKDALMPYFVFAQTAPKIALVPLFVIWFGIGFTSKIILIISMVFFPVMAGIMLGIESIPNDFRNLMKIINASKWQTFKNIEIPSSLPMLFSGFKVGIIQAVIGAIVAEWISGKQGLGYILVYASSTYNTALLIAGILVSIIVGIIFYEAVNIFENKLLYWHESKRNS